VIDRSSFFVRGCLEIPVRDAAEPLISPDDPDSLPRDLAVKTSIAGFGHSANQHTRQSMRECLSHDPQQRR
jgi:hypothetical protein